MAFPKSEIKGHYAACSQRESMLSQDEKMAIEV